MVHSGVRYRWRRTIDDFRRGLVRSGLAQFQLHHDATASRLLAASVLGVVALTAYIAIWLPTLPLFLPLHYNGVGSVDLIGPRTDLFKMPVIGVAVFLADVLVASLMYRRDRWASLTILGASVLVQIMLIVATINIVRLAFGD